MARPKKFLGTERDGFVSFRIPAEMSDRINCLCFLLEKSGSEVVQMAMADFISKYKDQVDKLYELKNSLRQTESQ